MATMHERAAEYFADLQDRITSAFAEVEQKPFHQDEWTHAESGGGRTRVIGDGTLLEKGGVNFSRVAGTFSAEFAQQIPGDGREFTATGISLVLHPWNPHVPTVHANFRYLTKGTSKAWFGGGADLTPYYLYPEDAVSFHRVWKGVCDRHPGVADYRKMKDWCDEYFFLTHRREARGIGGIFFDYVEDDPEKTFDFVRDAGDHFIEAYLPIVKKRMNHPHTEEERDFQLYRRGRYVEFNLVYDRGTIFGLKTGGRIESILMSLPQTAKWIYDWHPTPGTREAELYDVITKPRDWLAASS